MKLRKLQMLSDALYKSAVDDIVKVLVNSTSKRSIPTYYYLLNTTVEALRLPFWREVSIGSLQLTQTCDYSLCYMLLLNRYINIHLSAEYLYLMES